MLLKLANCYPTYDIMWYQVFCLNWQLWYWFTQLVERLHKDVYECSLAMIPAPGEPKETSYQKSPYLHYVFSMYLTVGLLHMQIVFLGLQAQTWHLIWHTSQCCRHGWHLKPSSAKTVISMLYRHYSTIAHELQIFLNGVPSTIQCYCLLSNSWIQAHFWCDMHYQQSVAVWPEVSSVAIQ